MKHIKYLLFLFIIFITPNVFAYDYDVTNSITAPTGPATGGHYLGLEIYNSGSQNNYTVNTRYNGTLSEIIFNLPLPSNAGQCFTTNMDYTVTMEMATSDWRNHFTTPFVSWYSGGTNWKSSNVTFVSMKKIYFKFKIPSTETSCTDFVYVRLRSPSVSTTAFTGETNWNLSKITLSDGYSSSGGSGGGSGGGSNIDPNQGVIDNANQNTTDIIDNANQNTKDIIDSNLVCKAYSLNDSGNLYDGYLGSTGIFYEQTGNYNKTTDFILVPEDSRFFLKKASTTNKRLCFYNSSKQNTGCYTTNEFSNGYEFTIPNNSSYFRINFEVSENSPIINLCSNGNQALNDSINRTNDYLMDDSNPSIEDNDFLTMFNSIGINDPLSYLLTLPVQFINKIVSLSDTCTAINLGTLYGTMITLPCINLENILGTSVWNIIDVIFSVSLLVVVLKNLYDTFSNLLTMGAEKEAKEKFSMPTPMDFLSMILGGDR